MDPQAAFRADAQEMLRTALGTLCGEPLPPLEVPPDRAMGDIGVPCFPLAKALRKAPPAIAAELAAACAPTGWIKEVRAVGPYVNVFMDRGRLASVVLGDVHGCLRADAVPGKVLLEHTSANPNGPLHIGRARNPILGDTMYRLMVAAGHDVEVQYYMDNLGRQVALLWYGKTKLDVEAAKAERDKPDHDLVRFYQAANDAMETDEAIAREVKALVAKLETADADLLADVRAVYEACFAGMRQSLDRLGVHHDSIKDESDLVASGAVDMVIKRLQESDRHGTADNGAHFLDMAEELGGNKSTRFFFTRGDGTSVYATRDVAYHQWKAEQVGPEGRLLNILGEDHRLQAKQVAIALDVLGCPVPDVVFYAFVSLPDGKMSTRAGRVVFLDDLLDEAVARAAKAVRERRGDELAEQELAAIAEAVGVAAVRFSIARIQPEKPIQFEWDSALDFDGDSAPYLMYAHARAASLLRKADEEGLTSHVGPIGTGEEQLASIIASFVATAKDAVDARAPHRFCQYALDLASAFNAYYRDHPVLTCEDAAVQGTRLAMIGAAKEALAAAHRALGLPVLDSM